MKMDFLARVHFRGKDEQQGLIYVFSVQEFVLVLDILLNVFKNVNAK